MATSINQEETEWWTDPGTRYSWKQALSGSVNQQEPEWWTDLLKILGVTTGLGAISYVFGFITVNSFLGAHGIITSSANSQYLAPDVSSWLFLFIIGLIIAYPLAQVLPSSIWDQAKAQAQKYLDQKLADFQRAGYTSAFRGGFQRGFRAVFPIGYVIGFVFGYVIGLIIRYGIAFLVAVGVIVYVFNSNLRPFESFYFYSWVFGTIAAATLFLDFVTNRRRAILAWSLFAVWLSAFCYGPGLYPYLPASMGGAAPVQVRFVIDPKDKELVQSALGLALDSAVTPEIRLLLETSGYFVISIKRDNADHTAQLKKDLVKAVLYQKSV
jgi:hypothetical protein